MNKVPLSLNNSFKFGRHKGKSVKEVIEEDPYYILWARDSYAARFMDEVIEAVENKLNDNQ